MQGQLWFKFVGDLIIARVPGNPKLDILRQYQEQVLSLVRDAGRGVSLRRVLVLLLLGLPLGFGQGETSFWRDAGRLRLLGIERLAGSDFAEAVPLLEAAARLEPRSALGEAWLAHAFHLARRLDEAGTHYRRLLELDPPAAVDAARRHAMLRHAPRVFQVASDPFPLLDAVAVHHPEEPLIAYHFFWEDDVDFPDDHDPCDHELVWVRYDPATGAVVGFWTYFHGRILYSEAAVRAANAAGGRARVNVQWGKHGSLPQGWEALSIQANTGDIERAYLDLARPRTLLEYNRATFEKLTREGRAHADHPRTAAWPVRFAGSWEDFVRFDREVPFARRLEERRTIAVSRWSNAVLEQRLLAYNFRPKTEWPDRAGAPQGAEAQLDRRVGASGEGLMAPSEATTLRAAASVDPDPFLMRAAVRPAGLPVDLPSMAPFRPETPRYPNLWLYAPGGRFASYADFVGELRSRFSDLGYDTNEVNLNEGADLAVSIEHLEPWGDVHGLSHAHALHLRLFWKRLERDGLHRATGAQGEFWRVAASVHYEVEHASPLHADVRSCPVCGRTGGYARASGNLVEVVHDPLGLELALTGRVRGREVLLPGKGPLRGLVAGWKVKETDLALSLPFRQDVNTGAVAVVFLR